MSIVFLPPSAAAAASTDTLDDVTGRGATTSNSVQVGGLNMAGAYTLPTSDGTANQVLQTDGAGAISFTNISITGGLTYKTTFNVATATPSIANAVKGDFYIVSGTGTLYGKNWVSGDHLVINDDMGGVITNSKIDQIDNTDQVSSVNALTGAVVLDGTNIDGDHTAVNYSTANDKLESHLGGIDTKFGTLGTMSTQAANSVNITGGSVAGITALAIADGGTGASSASDARTNLGVAIGSDVQAYDAQLVDVAGLTPSTDHVIVGNGANFTAATLGYSQISGTPTIGSIASQAANSVNITGGSISGITDLAIADGGTGASDAATALSNLGGIGNVVDDTSPQLGGALDTNSNAITSASNANVEITPHGTGFVKLGGNTNPGTVALYDEAGTNYIGLKAPLDADIAGDTTFTLPAADGTAGQVLKTDGAGVLSFVNQTGGATPTLDAVTGAGATTTNSIQVGGLNIGGNYSIPTADGSAGQVLKTDGAGAVTFQALGSMSTQAANSVNITGGAISGITDLAIADGGTGASDAATALSNLGGIGNVVDDTSPQLGGALDTNSNAITSASNGNVEITPHGTGFVKLGGNTNPGTVALYDEAGTNYIGLKAPLDADIGANTTFTLPAADGTAGQVLKTDGAGVLSFVSQSGGGSAPTVSTLTASSNQTHTLSAPSAGVIEQAYKINNTTYNVTIALVASATVGAGFKYQLKRLGSGTVTVDPNGSETIDHTGQTTLSIGAQYDSITLMSDGSNWIII